MHARVEDAIRTGKDTGIGKFQSHQLSVNRAWLTAAPTAATLLAWLRLLALDSVLARAEPKTLRYRILHAAGRLTSTPGHPIDQKRSPGPVKPPAIRPASRATVTPGPQDQDPLHGPTTIPGQRPVGVNDRGPGAPQKPCIPWQIPSGFM